MDFKHRKKEKDYVYYKYILMYHKPKSKIETGFILKHGQEF